MSILRLLLKVVQYFFTEMVLGQVLPGLLVTVKNALEKGEHVGIDDLSHVLVFEEGKGFAGASSRSVPTSILLAGKRGH